jgi:hypothetical protein
MGIVIIDGHGSGKEVLVSTQAVAVLLGELTPFHDYVRRVKITDPLDTPEIICLLRRADFGKVIAPKVIMDVDESRYERIIRSQLQTFTRYRPDAIQTILFDRYREIVHRTIRSHNTSAV